MAQLSERDAEGNGPIDVMDRKMLSLIVEMKGEFPDDLDQLQGLKAAAEYVELRKSVSVRRARESGKTWQQIADALGITRQAAQKRWAYIG